MPGRDELREILVDVEITQSMPAARRRDGERADHVVRLDAFDHQERPAVRADELVQRLDLRDEILRHRRRASPCTADTSRRGTSCPERRTRRRSSRASRLRLSCATWTARRAAHRSARRGRAQIRQRVKCAIQIRRPIHQNERRHVSDHQDSGTHRSAGDVHHQRAGSLAGAGDYGRVRCGDRTAARRAARGLDVRQRAHQAGSSVLREGRAHRAVACPTRASP